MDGTIQVTTATTEPTTEAMDGTIQVTTAATEPTTKTMDGTIQMTTAATEPTTEAMDGTIQVTTATTKPTTEAMDSTMQVTTAAMETTETTGIFDISKIISIKIKELRSNSDSIPNNISCNELPNSSTPKSKVFSRIQFHKL